MGNNNSNTTNELDAHIEDALDEVDAALFSGDKFHNKESVERLEYFINRWQRGLDEIKTVHLESE